MTSPPAAEAHLRAHGLRVTPQRRAILDAFAGGAAEHLSADEVHARAARSVPELSRGTVYATLAELAELGLLGAIGHAEPVRYETNISDHAHFCCRICLRMFDLDEPLSAAAPFEQQGHVVERTIVRAEGICAACGAYAHGLAEGLAQLRRGGPGALPPGAACREIPSPVGALLLAATSAGMVRVAYDDQADAPALREQARSRRGSRAARDHLAAAQIAIDAYFAGTGGTPECVVDWAALPAGAVSTLQAVARATRYGADASYTSLDESVQPHARGVALGSNPLALLIPCHRVSRGRHITDVYIGGPERKRYLRTLERAHAA